jgi:tRNA threonylcarbamoyladenosine biosynthesis protein TsaB
MLLAVDTSTRTMGIALYDGAQVLSETVWTSRDYHTVELAPAVARVLARPGLTVENLQVLAVATGPGSFTGLRVGMALVKGLALAAHLPVIGIPSLDVLVEAQPVKEAQLAAVLRAGRGRLAVGWYQAVSERWQATSQVEILSLEALSRKITGPTQVCGELTAEERRSLARKRKNVILASPASSLRRPSFLAELAWRRWEAGKVDDPATLAPFYLHYHEFIPG